jgi:hypothetical protein
VRNHEIIAAAGHADNSVIIMHNESTEDEPPIQDLDDLELDAAMNNGEDNKETLFHPFTGFTAIPNAPEVDDNPSANNDSSGVQINKHQSHWSKCNGGWESLYIE